MWVAQQQTPFPQGRANGASTSRTIMTEPSFTIKLDASLYDLEQAEQLYVEHPEGFPEPERNALIVGAMGSGKTMMLRALQARWAQPDSTDKGLYIDLSHWVSSIASDTSPLTGAGLSPRTQNLRSALELTIAYALASEAGVFRDPEAFPETFTEFSDATVGAGASAVRVGVKRAIRETVLRDAQVDVAYPKPYFVASAIGRDVQGREGRRAVFLIDQVDQVSAAYFEPISSLLRRSANHVTYVATRPCPTAPDREELPEDVIEGDAFDQFLLGRTREGLLPEAFLGKVLEGLPLESQSRSELLARAELLGNLTWPSLRAAISVAIGYVKGRRTGRTVDQAWYEALTGVAEDYEKIVNSTAAAYCQNPKRLLGDWRDMTYTSRGGKKVTPLGRTELILPQIPIYDAEQPSGGEKLFRILIKRGTLLLGDRGNYKLGALPGRCEVHPLLLVNDSRFDPAAFAPDPTKVEVPQKRLRAWAKTGGRRRKSSKDVFVSYWMSSPRSERESLLAEHVRKEFGASLTVRTGRLQGSPRWSPEIMNRIKKADILLCDLTTPRPDVFVEYGVGVGAKKPIIQVTMDENGSSVLPAWCRARQFQFYEEEGGLTTDLTRSIAGSLDVEPSAIERWVRDSSGRSIEGNPTLDQVAYVGPHVDERLEERLKAAASERDFRLGSCVSDPEEDNLEAGIRLVRSASVAVLAFDATNADYLTSVLGGVFASRPTGSFVSSQDKKRKKFFRKMYLIDLSEDKGVPGLLKTHDGSELARSMDDLLHRLRSGLGRFQKKRREAR